MSVAIGSKYYETREGLRELVRKGEIWAQKLEPEKQIKDYACYV